MGLVDNEKSIGEETDDRPPPSEIHVAPFDETAKEFMLCGVHSQQMALVSESDEKVWDKKVRFSDVNWNRNGYDIIYLCVDIFRV